MSDIEFVDGLMVKAPSEKAPEFVKCGISIKRANLIKWLTERKGEWVNLQVKVSRDGKWYAQVDNWKPESQADQAKAAIREPGSDDAPMGDDGFDQDIPFMRLQNEYIL